jgi:hypothetical protein
LKDWLRTKLATIAELFPEERISKSRQRIEALWRGKKPTDRYPFTYGTVLFNYYNAVHTPEERLRASLDEFTIHGRLNDDFIPSLFPGCRPSTIPSMLGAREVVKEGFYTCERIITQKEDIDRLPDPSTGPGTVAREWLSMQRYFLEETEGKIPIHVTDMQGPADVCGQLMSYEELFLMAYEQPEYYHKLMNKATDAFILFWKAQKDLLGEKFVGTHLFGHNWVPPEFGASVSADSLVMIGPMFYEEFYKPYLVAIGQAFGDISVHSCGDFSANIKSLCATPHVKGINASQMGIEELLNAGLDRKKVIIAFCDLPEIPSVYELIRGKSLRVDLNIENLPWPKRGDEVLPPSQWTESDWVLLRECENSIIEQARSQS